MSALGRGKCWQLAWIGKSLQKAGRIRCLEGCDGRAVAFSEDMPPGRLGRSLRSESEKHPKASPYCPCDFRVDLWFARRVN